jgi:hypothetical protein
MRGKGHLPHPSAAVVANLSAAYRDLMAVLGKLPSGGHYPDHLTKEQVTAADNARRYMAAAAAALRSAQAAQGGQRIGLWTMPWFDHETPSLPRNSDR